MKDYTGVRIGELVGVRFDKRVKAQTFWVFACDCGNLKSKPINKLKRKKSDTCNCVKGVRDTNTHNISSLYHRYASGAKTRGYNFDLTGQAFFDLVSSNCHYCGSEPSQTHRRVRKVKKDFIFIYNGIDRKNNELGYTPDNCVTCCAICNRAKKDISYTEFKEWVLKLKNR
jgi:5-methylcytosine-specific restriction endonuclease McrA